MFRTACACVFLMACSTEVDSPVGGTTPEPTKSPPVQMAAPLPPPAPSSPAAPTAGAPAAPSCSWGAMESEPNDIASSATTTIGGRACGSLSSAGDIDWFSFDTSGACIVTLHIQADGDAEALLVAPDGRSKATKPGDDAKLLELSPGRWTVQVRSASGAKQAYEVTLSSD